MLKRLLTAVFVLGLILTLNGTAFSDIPKAPAEMPTPTLYKPGVDNGHKVLPKGMIHSTPFADAAAAQVVQGSITNAPTPSGLDTTACYFPNYAGNLSAGGAYTRNSATLSSVRFAMRMDGAQANNHISQIYGAWPLILAVSETATPNDTVEVTIGVWTDVGGIPGTLVYSEDFAIEVSTFAPAYLPMYFTAPIELDAPNFHISMGPKLTGPATDLIQFRSDAAGNASSLDAVTGRGSVFTGSAPTGGRTPFTWYDALGVFFSATTDPNWNLYVDYCEVYSECYSDYPGIPDPGYVWGTGLPATFWSDGSTLNGMAQRFVAATPETLTSVRFIHEATGGAYYDGTSTNGLKFEIFPDLAGNVDYSGGALATVMVPGGAGLFPNTGIMGTGFNVVDVDLSPFNLIFTGPYHVAVSVTSDNPADGRIVFENSYEIPGPYYTDGSGMSVNFTAPGNQWENTGANATWLAEGDGTETGFLVRGTHCLDEFSLCETGYSYHMGSYRLLGMANGIPGYLRVGLASYITAGQVNSVSRIRVDVYDECVGPPNPGGTLDNGNPMLKVAIYQALPGPNVGVTLWDTVVSPVYGCTGWTEVVIPGGFQVLGDFFIGYEPVWTAPLEWMYAGRERVGDPGVTTLINGGMYILLADYPLVGDTNWVNNVASGGANDNGVMDVEFCSIPPNRLTCAPSDTWTTAGHDFTRSYHSLTGVGDAQCDLNQAWIFTHPTQLSLYSSPIIYDTFVISAFTNGYKILNINDGTVVQTLDNTTHPLLFGATNVRCTPTIATIDVGGTPKPVMFVGGGSLNSVMAYDMSVIPTDTLWSMRVANSWRGLGNIGITRYTNFIVLNDGTDDVLYFGTESGKVQAVYAEDGNAYTPWGVGAANATVLNGSVLKSGATDGTDLYYALFTTGLTGDIASIDAATGNVNWLLSGSGGLRGTVIYPASVVSAEGFEAGVAITPDDGQLYAVSTCQVGNHPADGVFYRIDASNGAVLSAVASTASFGAVSSPMTDAARIYVAGRSRWVSPPLAGQLHAFNRFTGNLVWTGVGGGREGSGYFSEALMTCDDGLEADLIFGFTDVGYLGVFNSATGDEIYHRRIDPAASVVGGGGAFDGTNMVFQTFNGDIIAMKKGVDRPRLEILDYTVQAAVPFGSGPATIVNIPNVYTNTGCAPLTVTQTADLLSNGVTIGQSINVSMLDNNVANRAAMLADRITSGQYFTSKDNDLDVTPNFDVFSRENISKLSNAAASAVPPYLNVAVYGPYVVNAGDTAGISLNVNGPLILRGPNRFYMEFASDDPDFFLSTTVLDPEVLVNLVGGCLTDTTFLDFGAASANWQIVTNSTRLGDGDWQPSADVPGPGNFSIDGVTGDYFQGGYMMGVDSHRVATNVTSWQGGEGPDDGWFSVQPDPNFCDGLCLPTLYTGVSLGTATTDGVTPLPLTGNLVCKTWIDTVSNYADTTTGVWDWRFYTAPYDNVLTMGLKGNSKTFAIVDAPLGFELLNNVTVEVMRVWQRDNLALPNWKFGMDTDYDVGNDTAALDQSISAVWAYARSKPATGDAMGMIKLPFGGCDQTPMINVRALQALQGQFESTNGHGNPYMDSLYFYLSLPSGSATSQNIAASGGDQQMHATIAAHDFVPGDTFTFGVAHFLFHNVTDPKTANAGGPGSQPIADLARLVNKWVGFGRGDVNNDNTINLVDIVYLSETVAGGPTAIPFAHLGDVNTDGFVDGTDVTYLVNYYFSFGPCPTGAFVVGL